MKLTPAQLDNIDRFLEQHQLDFLDFKIEVKDHLATATEVIMEEDELAFEDAFVKVSENWESALKVEKYWLISNERQFPKMVIENIKTTVFVHYTAVIVIVFALIYFYYEYRFEHWNIFKYAVGLCGVVYFILKRIVRQHKISTSYRFHLEYFNLYFLMVFAYFFVFNISFPYANFVGFIVLADFPFAVYNFYKHQQFIKKINSI